MYGRTTAVTEYVQVLVMASSRRFRRLQWRKKMRFSKPLVDDVRTRHTQPKIAIIILFYLFMIASRLTTTSRIEFDTTVVGPVLVACMYEHTRYSSFHSYLLLVMIDSRAYFDYFCPHGMAQSRNSGSDSSRPSESSSSSRTKRWLSNVL
jgi:hypothetical protein